MIVYTLGSLPPALEDALRASIGFMSWPMHRVMCVGAVSLRRMLEGAEPGYNICILVDVPEPGKLVRELSEKNKQTRFLLVTTPEASFAWVGDQQENNPEVVSLVVQLILESSEDADRFTLAFLDCVHEVRGLNAKADQ